VTVTNHPSYVFLNDRLVSSDDAKVSVFDWGFLYGDTLFETIRVHRGVPLLWTAHVRRLLAGCEALGYPDTPDAATLRSAVDQTLAAHDYDDAVVRVTVSRGRGTAGLDMRRTIDPTLVVTARPYEALPHRWTEEGLRVRTVLVPVRAGLPRYRTKSGNYLDQLVAIREALEEGYDEALLVDEKRRILEGGRSNIFLVRGESIYTPPVRLGVLPGIMRDWVIKHTRRAGFEVRAKCMLVSKRFSFDEAFMTNSVWGVMPIGQVNDIVLDRNSSHRITDKITDLWNEWLERQTP